MNTQPHHSLALKLCYRTQKNNCASTVSSDPMFCIFILSPRISYSPVLVSFCCCDETFWPKAMWGRESFIWLMSPGHWPSQTTVRRETQRRSMKVETMEKCCWLASVYIYIYIYGWEAPDWGMMLCRAAWALLHQSVREPLTDRPMVQDDLSISSMKASPLRTPGCVKLTPGALQNSSSLFHLCL